MYDYVTEEASPAVKRAARREWELDHAALNAVFQAKETSHLQMLLDKDIYSNPAYQKLPKFRQLAVSSYFRGVCDAIARIAGVTIPLAVAERPKSAPPVKSKNKKRTSPKRPKSQAPELYPSNGIRTPLPEWLHTPPDVTLHSPMPTPTILPPSPFPFAADLGGENVGIHP
jgi:hypothetical protein